MSDIKFPFWEQYDYNGDFSELWIELMRVKGLGKNFGGVEVDVFSKQPYKSHPEQWQHNIQLVYGSEFGRHYAICEVLSFVDDLNERRETGNISPPKPHPVSPNNYKGDFTSIYPDGNGGYNMVAGLYYGEKLGKVFQLYGLSLFFYSSLGSGLANLRFVIL